FEEYDHYSQKKEFLVSDSFINFTDTNGKLMALKPDVTLSIVKNTADIPAGVQRVYYNENVYRVSDNTHSYMEIMQAGLECLGNVGTYDLCEVLLLAAESLQVISTDSVLNLSHLGIVTALLEPTQFHGIRKQILNYIGEKNTHEITRLCQQRGIDDHWIEMLCYLCTGYGSAHQVLAGLKRINTLPQVNEAIALLETVTNILSQNTAVPVLLDLSLVSNTNYYNGLIFRGYVKDIPTDVLRGGQYDKLMKRLGKTHKAIGFAVYLDALERTAQDSPYDADVLLTYTPNDSIEDILTKAVVLRGQGKQVDVQACTPNKKKYAQEMQVKGDS
ncbi:MAG: ATP phosphoribosyltransferase regulatory subunit, partial [Clostridia bacterium]|nr:ATP phosphoribosyltransferase regulatory subunit [Clostridia bacterium]